MDKKTYTQFGKFSVIVLLPLLILSLVLLFIFGLKNLSLGITLIFLSLTFFVCLLIFYKLTISIDSTHLSFSLGIGLVSKKYLLTDIKSCKPVKNNPIYGIGIRLIPDGWLYNVSGSHAIELTFKNRNSKVRIGTDLPEEIALLINKRLDKENTEIASAHSTKSYYFLAFIIILLVVIFPLGIILYGIQEVKAGTKNSELSIKGMYGLTIKFPDINQIDTISILPKIKRRTNGFILGRTLKGNYTFTDSTKAKLFITLENPPYINIKTDDLNLYINFRDRHKTVEMFNSLTARLKHDQK
jgi:hypothetical protein